MGRSTIIIRQIVVVSCAALFFMTDKAQGESGFYLGGSVGGATIERDVLDPDIPELPTTIDEDDTAWKIFGGYKFDLPVIDLGIEGGYVDFGRPEIDTGLGQIEFDTNGINLWGVAGLDLGPIDIFAKLGYVFWDVETSVPGAPEFGSPSEDGTDIGYGIGAAFNFGPLAIRGEYEIYDIDQSDVSMLSIGLSYQF